MVKAEIEKQKTLITALKTELQASVLASERLALRAQITSETQLLSSYMAEKTHLETEKARLTGGDASQGNVSYFIFSSSCADWLPSFSFFPSAFFMKSDSPTAIHPVFVLVRGEAVDYVAPPDFERTILGILNFATSPGLADKSEPSNPFFPYVVVQGAAGCGKTRFGYEIYRRLAHEAKALASVSYKMLAFTAAPDYDPLPVNVVDRQTVREQQERSARLEVAKLLEKGTTGVPPGGEDYLKRLVLAAKAAHPNKRTVVVVHIDEYQNQPNRALAIHRVCRDITDENFRVVVVLTGLLADPVSHELLPVPFGMTGGMALLVTLHYVPSEEQQLQLLVNSMRATKQIITVGDIALQHPRFLLLKRLLHDLQGWPLAIVKLGGVLHSTALSRSDADIKKVLQTAELLLRIVVDEVYRTRMDEVLKRNKVNVEKLLRVAMSPFAVRLWRWRGG